MSDHPDQPTTQRAIQTVDLGDRAGDNAKLVAALEAIAERVNEDATGGWKVTEWLSNLSHACGWSISKFGKAARWGVKRFTEYEKRQAEAYKIRMEGRATATKAKSDAELTSAKARTERAKAREQEIKNETAEELLQQLKARGIDMRVVREASVDVAVVKESPLELPDSHAGPKQVKKRRPRKKPGQSGDQPAGS